VRNIAIFLLLSNVIYFVWNQFGSKSENLVIVEPPGRSGENSLILISELDSSPEPIGVSNVASNLQSSTACFSTGDFLDLNDASQFRDFVSAAGFESTLNLTQDLEKPSYRVYLQPFSSQIIAENSLEAIKEAIEAIDLSLESGLITEGSMVNGVAFGVFDTQYEADVVQSQLAELGYITDIDQVFGVDTVIRVLVSAENSPTFEAQIWP